MRLLWPSSLYLLASLPLIILAYVWALRRRQRFALRYSSLSLLRSAAAQPSRWRHLPFALFLLGLGVLIAALSRPVTIVTIPTDETTVILALDVSGSMRSTDISPNRIMAAEQAALDFIRRQKAGTHVGIVAFSGNAELVQPPTTDTEALTAAIKSLYLGRATAIGSGILKSIDTIAEVDPFVSPSSLAPNAPAVTPTPVVPGAFAPDIIVVLTDGVSNAGVDPLEAAKEAANRGIRVYTIGFGTENGSIPGGPGGGSGGGPFRGGGAPGGGFGGGGFGGGGFGGGRFRTAIDEDTLKKIADETGGEYYKAASADQLQKVFQSLPTYLITRHEVMEITVGFTAAGALLTLLAIALSLTWSPLP